MKKHIGVFCYILSVSFIAFNFLNYVRLLRSIQAHILKEFEKNITIPIF